MEIDHPSVSELTEAIYNLDLENQVIDINNIHTIPRLETLYYEKFTILKARYDKLHAAKKQLDEYVNRLSLALAMKINDSIYP